jgi:hypothetical protein
MRSMILLCYIGTGSYIFFLNGEGDGRTIWTEVRIKKCERNLMSDRTGSTNSMAPPLCFRCSLQILDHRLTCAELGNTYERSNLKLNVLSGRSWGKKRPLPPLGGPALCRLNLVLGHSR